jgi:outer membrane PBP1 activator LpoA protein
LPEQALHLKQPLGNKTLSGWMSLARVFKLDPADLTNNILKWQKSNPAHPANSDFLAQYVKNYQHNLEQSELIAVFLPASGDYAAPAAVLKKGFMKAYKLAKKSAATHSEIRFYDTESSSLPKLYQQAIKDGARLVVGPLDKKDIKALVSNTELSIPVLALNQVEGLTHPKLYQFALNPKDDAGQITAQARQEGHQNAVFLVPKSEQGKRFSAYFTDSWQKLGGKAVKVQSYDDSKSDFSQLAQQIMKPNADDDEVDAIIINAYAKPARSLYAQLHKNKSTADLPVYATSQIYLGDADAARDRKLDGVTFCDVPWVINEAYVGELSKEALHDSWQDLAPSYLRLLPMGIDAYNLIGQLDQLKKQPYNGATGKLKLDSDNRITRELYCVKFVHGVPKALDFMPENPESDAVPMAKQPATATVATEKNLPALPQLPELDNAPNSQPAAESGNAPVK